MSDTRQPPFWLVWAEDGTAPRFKHVNQSSAEVEAQRLARLNPGTSFFVLCPTMRITRQDTIIERFDTSDDGIPF